MKRALALLLMTAAAMTLGACGQKGPLFLPGHAPESQTEAASGLDAGDDAQDETGGNEETARQVPDIHWLGLNGRILVTLKESDFLLDVWSFDNGKKVHPYKGQRGDKKGLFSVNFTNDTNNFRGMTESDLRLAITAGKFRDRGTVRMLPLYVKPGADRNAFAPRFYQGTPVKDF